MKRAAQLASRLRDVLLEGKVVANTNYQEQLKGLDVFAANKKVKDLNSMGLLAQHINYYLEGVIQVFERGELRIRDQYSFEFEPFENDSQWKSFKEKFLKNAELISTHVSQLENYELSAPFVKADYGSYSSNIEMMIEHCYYHLGQMVMIRKIIEAQKLGL